MKTDAEVGGSRMFFGFCAGAVLLTCAAGAGTFSDWRKPSSGTLLPTGGVTGGEAIELTGGKDERWASPALDLASDRRYAFIFSARGPASGSMTSGPSCANVDIGAPGADWVAHTNVFRSHTRPTPTYRETLHLGEWKMGGKVVFDDVKVVPVTPRWKTFEGGIELGPGESIDGNVYGFSSSLGSVARNDARPLVVNRAGFNTDRWCLGKGSEVVYRHNVAGRRMLKAQVSVTCGYYARGSAAIEVSNNGSEWTSLFTITNSSSPTAEVPSKFFPTEALWVRFRGLDPCILQIPCFSVDATIDGSPMNCFGAVEYVEDGTGKIVAAIKSPSFYDEGYGARLPCGTDAVALWTASSGWKIPRRRALPKEAVGVVKVKTAANEAEAVQLVVAARAALSDVLVSANDLRDAKGHVLSASAIDVLRVGYVPVKQPTDGVGCRALWPDPLPLQDGTLAVSAGENQPFWIRVKPPKGTPAGLYRGTLTVKTSGMTSEEVSVPFEVEVFGFELPDRMTCETGFGFDSSTVARYHGLKTLDQRKAVTAKYLRSLADHHISPYNPAPYARWRVTWRGLPAWKGGTRDTGVKFSGAASMRVVDDSKTGNPSLVYADPIPLGRKGVKISFRYRTATEQSFNVCFGHRTKSGAWLSGRNRDFRLEGAKVWTRFEAVHDRIPATAVTADLAFYPGGWRDDGTSVGTIWLDDVSIVDVETGKPLVVGGDFDSVVDPAAAEPVFDWTDWDREMQQAIDTYHFTGFRLPIDGLGGGTYESRHEPSLLGVAATDPAYDVLMGKYLRGIESHLREKGWLDMAYVYWFDEPETKDYDFVMKGFDTLKRHAPGLRRMLTEEAVPALLGGPNLWVPLTPYLHAEGEAKARAVGDAFWWYVCCGPKAPYVTEFTDHPGSEMRLWLWQTWGEDVKGVLIWATTYWTSSAAYPDRAHPQNPYEDAMCWVSGSGLTPGAKRPWGNGDGRFLYPPLKAAQPAKEPVLDGPVDSYRLEMLRDGIEDYEYFAMLKRALATKKSLSAAERARYEALLKVPASVYTSLTDFATDPASMEDHRVKLARALEELAARD